jgi:hypothetical protein
MRSEFDVLLSNTSSGAEEIKKAQLLNRSIESSMVQISEMIERLPVRALLCDIVKRFEENEEARSSVKDYAEVLSCSILTLPKKEAETVVRKVLSLVTGDAIPDEFVALSFTKFSEMPEIWNEVKGYFEKTKLGIQNREELEMLIAWMEGDSKQFKESLEKILESSKSVTDVFAFNMFAGLTERSESLAQAACRAEHFYASEEHFKAYAEKFPESARKIAVIMREEGKYYYAGKLFAYLGDSDMVKTIIREQKEKSGVTEDSKMILLEVMNGDFESANKLFLSRLDDPWQRLNLLWSFFNEVAIEMAKQGEEDLPSKVLDGVLEKNNDSRMSGIVPLMLLLGQEEKFREQINRFFSEKKYAHIAHYASELFGLLNERELSKRLGVFADVPIKNSTNGNL